MNMEVVVERNKDGEIVYRLVAAVINIGEFSNSLADMTERVGSVISLSDLKRFGQFGGYLITIRA